MGGALSAMKGMISFFTLWHMDITQEDMDAMETRFHMVPVVGLLFGILLTVELGLFFHMHESLGYGSAMMVAVMAMLTVYVGSKFLHFDGLTDFGDGMIVSGPPESHLRALKDTLVGAGGIGVALVVTFTSFALYSSIPGWLAMFLIVPVVEVMVKNAQVFAASWGIAGKGMAGRQVERTTKVSAVKSVMLSLVFGAVLCILASVVADLVGVPMSLDDSDLIVQIVSVLIAGIVSSAIVGVLMARVANRNFGMVNGDILGATNEISRPVVVFVMSIVFLLVI